jgi:hypothetical protein
MAAFCFLLIAVLVALPIGWFVSEFWNHRPLRITLGILAIAGTTFLVGAVNQMLTTFNYNAWYGFATKKLLETSLVQIEDGHLDRVLKIWRGLNFQYHPTYENRAEYKELVEAATARMKGDVPIEPQSAWDAPIFTEKTWIGHWENDTGFWVVIADYGSELTILRSGDPTTKKHPASLSNDNRVLQFEQCDQLCTMTLMNKYEAFLKWPDGRTDTMHKLVRPTDEQKKMTQQNSPPSVSPRPHKAKAQP